jgi:hypothetical protein
VGMVLGEPSRASLRAGGTTAGAWENGACCLECNSRPPSADSQVPSIWRQGKIESAFQVNK